MENGKFPEEIPSAHNIKFLRRKNQKANGCNKNKTAEKEFSFINSSEF
jgi:hypothetical protein